MKKSWWNFWKKEHVVEVVDKKLVISEPVKTIANLMIRDRKRFVIDKFNSGLSFPSDGYNILDLWTGEEFRISLSYHYMSDYVIGPSWAKEGEIIWAYRKVTDHYYGLFERMRRIKKIRERNRLLDVYIGDNK